MAQLPLHGLQNEPKRINSSAPLFSMYNERTKEHDEKMAESWKGDAEGILVFTGLFSAAVAQLLGSSLQNLQPDPQNASSFYLARIYQLTPGSNASSISLPDDPDTFKPPKSAIWVSTLWSFSLVISLTCALLATLLQQWARRYLRITQKWNDPQKRAQTRELMWEALRKPVHLRWMVELLPFLLHFSVFLFLAGFVAYLFTFNPLVAKLVAGCAGIVLLVYLCISMAPIISCGSPYSTPLTTVVSVIAMGFISMFHCIRYFVALYLSWSLPEDAQRIRKSIRKSILSHYRRMLKGTTNDVETVADTPSLGLATSVLLSTFDSLDGDSDIEQFLSCIPGFYDSTSAQEHIHEAKFDGFNSDLLPSSIVSYMNHVLSSTLPDSEKQNRVAICTRAINANTSLLRSTFKKTLQTLHQTPNSDIFRCADFVHLTLEQLCRVDADPWVKDYAQCIVAIAINRTHLNDNTWIDIAGRYLQPQHAHYRWEVHNLRLCNLIYLTQRLKDSQLGISDQFARGKDWYLALIEARKLELRGIAPVLRHEFLTLWNELADVAQDNRWDPTDPIRQNAYIVLSLLSTVYAYLRP